MKGMNTDGPRTERFYAFFVYKLKASRFSSLSELIGVHRWLISLGFDVSEVRILVSHQFFPLGIEDHQGRPAGRVFLRCPEPEPQGP